MKKRQDWIIIERLGDIILNNVEGHLFEVGIGFSTPILSKLAVNFDRDFYCLDKNKDRCNWAMFFGCKVIQGKSLNTMEQLSEIPLAMGLIDGRHHADIVTSEISFFLKGLSIGGIIFLHDTYRQTSPLLKRGREESSSLESKIGSVYKVRQELEKLEAIQIFTWPYTAMNCGLTMVMKKDPDRPYYEI